MTVRASPPPAAEAVICDLDGTLLDTLEDLAHSMNRVLAGMGFPAHAAADYKGFVGEGVSVLVRKSLPVSKQGDDVCISRGAAAMREEYQAHCMDATRPYPGIPELLKGLHESGVAIAVLSNKPHAMVEMLLKKYFPSVLFAAASGAREGLPLKPDPAGALAIAGALMIPPQRCLFLGDSKTDMETAVAAGMFPIGALWGFRDAAELREHGAKALIERPEELLELIRSNKDV